ncbi:hypothetical protein Tco_1028951 [Tanacetum coccineum]|uniref:Uncharacterized protein n=1 Tax=Tanacetum coccineum TaxID=301880 RepID=A0ABQ5G233_9ASTR
MELVNKHLESKEIENMMEGSENVIDDSLPPRNDEPNIPGTKLEPRSDKESPEVEITNNEEMEITNVVIHVNVNEEEEEITDEVYELKRREKRNIVEESSITPFPTLIRSPRIHTNLVSSDTKKLQELTGRYTYLFEHLKERFLSRKSFDTLANHLQGVMVKSLPTMVDTHIKEQVKKQVPEQVRDQVLAYVAEGLILERQKTKEEMERMVAKAILQERGNIQAKISSQIQRAIDNQIPSQVDASMKFESLQVPQTTCRPSAVRLRDQHDPHYNAHPEGENHAKRQKTSYDDPEAPALSLINQDLLYLKKGSLGPEKIVLSLHKFPVIIFNDDDNENDFQIGETGLLWSLSVFIRSSVIWERVHDFQLGIESYQQNVNLTAPTISFPGVEKHKMFSIIYEPVHGIIYKNSKKEKRVMRHSEIHKELTNDEVEYLKLFEEEIEVRLKYRNQMRRWEMYVNERPLGPRREHPE